MDESSTHIDLHAIHAPKMIFRFFVLCLTTVTLALVSACAGMGPTECQYLDWRVKGEFDGREGAPVEKFEKYQKQCLKHNIMPDQTAWLQGREDGLQLFCVPDVGFAVGRQGKQYHDVCPPYTELAFIRGYRDGLSYYHAESEVNRVRSQINRKESRYDNYELDIQNFRQELEADDLSQEDRDGLEYKINKRITELGKIRYELRSLRDDLVDAEVDLELKKREMRRKGYEIKRRGLFS